MSQSAYIVFVNGSEVSQMTLDELKEQLLAYQDQTSRTGSQLDWDYADAAFPYTIETKPEGEGKWFYLKGKTDRYHYIVMGVGSKTEEDGEKHFIQVVLPDGASHGDKNKANEYCKFMGRRLKAEVRLFNGRIMYFNPRK